MSQVQTQTLENQGNSDVAETGESRLDFSKLDQQSVQALQMLVMQNYFGKFATKDDLDKFARKEDVANLRSEMNEKFGKVDKQFGELRGEITALRAEMKLLIYRLAVIFIGTFFLSAGSIIAFLNFFTTTP